MSGTDHHALNRANAPHQGTRPNTVFATVAQNHPPQKNAVPSLPPAHSVPQSAGSQTRLLDGNASSHPRPNSTIHRDPGEAAAAAAAATAATSRAPWRVDGVTIHNTRPPQPHTVIGAMQIRGNIDSSSSSCNTSVQSNHSRRETSSSDDEWDDVQAGDGFHLGCDPHYVAQDDDDDDDDDDDTSGVGNFFIPNATIELGRNRNRPALPYHSKEELAAGSAVWVADEEDMETMLKVHWSSAYLPVCNGRMRGHIKRHNGRMVLVVFHDDSAAIDFTLTIPRPCLLLKEIKPYESVTPLTKMPVTYSSYSSNLGPRAVGRSGRKSGGGDAAAAAAAAAAADPLATTMAPLEDDGDSRREERPKPEPVPLRFQYYEALSVMSILVTLCGDLAEAQDTFRSGRFEKAYAMVNECLAKHEPDWDARVEALLLRSRILVFLGRYDDALVDALECIRLEPQWLRGYLSAARAYSGLGKFDEAANMINRTLVFVPHSADLERVKDMNTYLASVQQRLVLRSGLWLTLDHLYRKRLRFCATAHEGQILCFESTPIVAMPSLVGPRTVGRCCVCFRDEAVDMEVLSERIAAPSKEASLCGESPVAVNPSLLAASIARSDAGSDGPRYGGGGGGYPLSSQAAFCSRLCQRRGSLFLHAETVRYREEVEQARAILGERATAGLDIFPLEMMNMTIRLFFMVVTTHRRLTRQQKHLIHAMQSQCGRGGAVRVTPPLSRAVLELHTRLCEPVQPPNPSLIGTLLARSSAPPKISVETALQRLGIYPTVSDRSPARLREKITSIYQTLTQRFKPEERKLYSLDVFSSLFSYVSAYFMQAQVPLHSATSPSASLPSLGQEPRVVSVYYLPCDVGAVHRVIGTSFRTSLGPAARHLERGSSSLVNPGESLLPEEAGHNSANCDLNVITSLRYIQGPLTARGAMDIGSTVWSPTSAKEGEDADLPRPSLLELVALREIRANEVLVVPPFTLLCD